MTVASERGSAGVVRVGWKLDDAAAEEAEAQYGEVPEGGVTKAEYEAARAADADVQKASEEKAEKGSEAAAALGWVPDETFMKEAERLYNEVPVGGVTQRDYEAGYTKEEDAAMHASFAEPSSEGDGRQSAERGGGPRNRNSADRGSKARRRKDGRPRGLRRALHERARRFGSREPADGHLSAARHGRDRSASRASAEPQRGSREDALVQPVRGPRRAGGAVEHAQPGHAVRGGREPV